MTTKWDVAMWRIAGVATLSCLAKYLGKEEMPFSALSPDFMVGFEKWLMANGRKESTVRFYLNQINTLHNVAANSGIVPKKRLLKSVKATIPVKQERELLSENELRRMRYADLSDSKPMTFARDMFFFSIYGRGHQFHRHSPYPENRHPRFHAHLYLASLQPAPRHHPVGRCHAGDS